MKGQKPLCKKLRAETVAGVLPLQKVMSLYEGENPYQRPAALFSDEEEDALSISLFKQRQKKPPCYTNLADLDCILYTLCITDAAFRCSYGRAPYIVVASKHGNPCGLAVDWSDSLRAAEKALFGYPLAIFGGEVITNFRISKKVALLFLSSKKRALFTTETRFSLDLVVAPAFSKGALEVLSRRRRLILFDNKALYHPFLSTSRWAYRCVRGGFLRQPPPDYILSFNKRDLKTLSRKRKYLDSLIIAWAAAWSSFSGGNEIAIAKERMLIGAGGGPATVDACCIAVERARKCSHDTEDSVFAADAFFPFTDGAQVLIDAGCRYGIVPRGGRNFRLIKQLFQKSNIKVFYLPERFRGFCRH